MSDLKTTPFFELQKQLEGRFVDFHGWNLPVQFNGIIEEHRHVREKVGLFDVSHMGEVFVRGPEAVAALDRVVTNSVAALEDGQACYTPICRPDGGIVDDVIVYRLAHDELLVCCNASNREKDFTWIRQQARGECEVLDRSDEFGQLALQGPRAPEVLAAAFPGEGAEIASLAPFRHQSVVVDGHTVLISTTGYTGERGFEFYIPREACATAWRTLWSAGADFELRPIGLGARDTLRLEMRYCLYGNDIDESTTPLEAGIAWAVAFDKPHFIGREALLAAREHGVARRLVGFRMVERGVPRQGYALYSPDDEDLRVGEVTSGTRSPSLGESIGLGYVRVPHHKRGRRLLVDVRGKRRLAKIVRTPFLRR